MDAEVGIDRFDASVALPLPGGEGRGEGEPSQPTALSASSPRRLRVSGEGSMFLLQHDDVVARFAFGGFLLTDGGVYDNMATEWPSWRSCAA